MRHVIPDCILAHVGHLGGFQDRLQARDIALMLTLLSVIIMRM